MFRIAKRSINSVEPFIHNLGITTGEAYALGEALKLEDGKLTKASGADKPGYICMGPVNGEIVPVIAVVPTTYFEVEASATVAETLIGSKVTLGTDGLTVTATEGGNFVIDETEGTTVVGHFE